MEKGVLPQLKCNSSFLALNDDELHSLGGPIQHEEIKNVVFEMGPSKAGGEDGLNAFFFQNQ